MNRTRTSEDCWEWIDDPVLADNNDHYDDDSDEKVAPRGDLSPSSATRDRFLASSRVSATFRPPTATALLSAMGASAYDILETSRYMARSRFISTTLLPVVAAPPPSVQRQHHRSELKLTSTWAQETVLTCLFITLYFLLLTLISETSGLPQRLAAALMLVHGAIGPQPPMEMTADDL